MLCWHQYEIIASGNYVESATSIAGKVFPQGDTTLVLKKCRCGKLKVQEVIGRWALKELQA